MIPVWLLQFYGKLELKSTINPLDWHIHELFFGFFAAIITGFLLTAIPNWTKRRPLNGSMLLVLVLIWAAGRLSISFSAYLDWQLVMLIDALFLTLALLFACHEIIKGKNWRNVPVLILLGLLLSANIVFHIEVAEAGTSDVARRIAMSAVVGLIILIGGRVIQGFTKNLMMKQNLSPLPKPNGLFDELTLLWSYMALAIWTVSPESFTAAIFLSMAAILHMVRLARWAGHRVINAPIIFILHLTYFFIPLGMALLALAFFLPAHFSEVSGQHALSIGAVAGMSLAIMVRASLGHTGRPIRATPLTVLFFTSIIISAIARIAAEFELGDQVVLYNLAAATWIIAFAGFGVVFAPILINPRATGR